jgi:putative membrane protein
MNPVLRWGGAAMVLALAACSSAPPPAPAPVAPPAPALSETDTTFINQAALGGMAEVQFGQLAAQKAGRSQVRDFAQKMVSDHTQLNQQLMQLAQAKGVTPPTELDPAHQAILARLQRERGATFDRDYMRGQIADHQATIALFQRESQEGTDPDLKNLAAQALPTLQQHLQMAQALVAPVSSGHHATYHTTHHTTTHHTGSGS